METHQKLSMFKQNTDQPIVQNVHYVKGKWIDLSLQDSKIIFFLKGEGTFSYDNKRKRHVKSKVIIYLPPTVNCILEIKEDATLFIMLLRNKMWITKWFSLEKLLDVNGRVSEDFFPLQIKDKINLYLQSLIYYLNDGLLDTSFYELKVMELFYLLKKYYPKEELASFFYPLLDSDIYFSDFVLSNYSHVKTVKEFAALNHQSISVFEKEFRRVFNETPYRWMKQRKLNRVLHEIKYTKKSFKEICYECGFSSPSQLSDFCKKHFGQPPIKIRKERETFPGFPSRD